MESVGAGVLVDLNGKGCEIEGNGMRGRVWEEFLGVMNLLFGVGNLKSCV